MSNTTIQIKRSSVTTQPGSLAAAEPAYSYLSDKLFIGDASGTPIAIGGRYFIDQLNVAFAVANAAYATANSSTVANDAYTVANAAFDKANSANVLAYNTGIGANNYSGSMANAANAYADATYVKLTSGSLQSVSSDINITGNLTVTGTTTYVNTATLLVSDNLFVLNSDLDNTTAPTQDAGMEINRGSSANVAVLWNETTERWTITNDGSNYLNIATTLDVSNTASSSNGYADLVGAAANAYAVTVGAASNAYAVVVGGAANAYSVTVGAASNAYADLVGTAANTNAANGSYISAGIVKVPYGGTGNTSLTDNGILVGRGTSAISTVYSSTEGNVLQINNSGVPTFGMLDGGLF